MLVEALTRTIRYRLRSGEEVRLRPGIPMDLPISAARQLLIKAAGLRPSSLGAREWGGEPGGLSACN